MKRCLNERGSRGEPPLLIIPLRKPQLLKGSKGLLMALQKPVRPKRVLAKPLVLSPIERKRVCNCSHKALPKQLPPRRGVPLLPTIHSPLPRGAWPTRHRPCVQCDRPSSHAQNRAPRSSKDADSALSPKRRDRDCEVSSLPTPQRAAHLCLNRCRPHPK